ncbi:MAG: nicotinate (nicotinamide) nucleotide adenylyltransferase, partial [Spirochaetaceae bacterium]|nr:nicotinate (nicotinamide) nucleotide adenylyltransferase [Spirochaetaceae bacterium]
MKFAVLGGSFDPVHIGHLMLAEAALLAGCDRVIFVPAFHSPYKSEAQRDSAECRLELLLAAIGANRRWTVDACEIKRAGVSYTIDTLRDIQSRYFGEDKPALILGDDVAADFPNWKNAAEIAEIADLTIARREQSAGENFPYPHKTLNNEVYKISSAEVRALIRSGGAWQQFVPDGARRIIERRGLYGAAGERGECDAPRVPRGLFLGGGVPPLDTIEDAVRSMLNVYRFLHSRNVALHCSDLALRWGLDADTAYLAGITHDMAKDIPDSEMIALAKKDGSPFSPLEIEKPAMLHGRAAAIMLEERFAVKDAAVIEAVRFHTTGIAGMGALAKIVYLADKIEAGRTTVDPKLRELAFGPRALTDLDELFEIV